MTLHAFPQFPARTIHNLDGVWDFQFEQNADPMNPVWKSLLFRDTLPVPGVFDTLPGSAGRRGVGFYRTVVTTEKRNLLLRIGGLGLTGTVFFDRRRIGATDLPYAPAYFEFQAEPGEHEIVIAVDNRLEASILFREFYDFYGHGGIYRSCELHELSDWAFRRAKITTVSIDGVIETEISFRGTPPPAVPLDIRIDGTDVLHTDEAQLKEGVIRLRLQVPPPAELWTPEAPALHVIEIRSGSEAVKERFGLRTVKAAGGQILLNGAPVLLRGVCRHESHPEFGPALPDQILAEDMAMLKDLGCNFVRGTHYPQDPRFLDLCDENGILVWEEGIGWGDRGERQLDPAFQDAQIRQMGPMIEESFNHPSVILRGFLNEGESGSEPFRRFHEVLAAEVRRLDPTRLVTFASMWAESDVCFDLMDVVAVNKYPGWYARQNDVTRPLNEIGPDLEKFLNWKKSHGLSDKPFILSEIGAGALYGWRDRMHAHWSEEYQADYLEEVCSFADRHEEEISGLAIWQYCDCRTYSSSKCLTRPRAFNNKGIADEYRRPKLAWDVVKKHFRKRD